MPNLTRICPARSQGKPPFQGHADLTSDLQMVPRFHIPVSDATNGGGMWNLTAVSGRKEDSSPQQSTGTLVNELDVKGGPLAS